MQVRSSHPPVPVGVLGLICIVMFAVSPLLLGEPGDRAETRPPTIDVVFSPGGGCQERISSEIEKAKKTVRVQAFYFTSKPMTDALIRAKKRGIDVCIILDKSQEKQGYGKWRLLKREGIPVYFDGKHATANNKIVLIDDGTLITGSFNFTKSAEEKNAENVLIIKNAGDVFEKYEANFDQHLKHSKKYAG